jgi:hypothetical protein
MVLPTAERRFNCDILCALFLLSHDDFSVLISVPIHTGMHKENGNNGDSLR